MKRFNKKDYLAVSLLIGTVVLTVVFIVNCIKKKSLLAALTALAAINVAGSFWLVERRRRGRYLFDFFDENDYEVFDDDEAVSAGTAVNVGLHRRHSSDVGESRVTPIFEIPVDDEATESEL